MPWLASPLTYEIIDRQEEFITYCGFVVTLPTCFFASTLLCPIFCDRPQIGSLFEIWDELGCFLPLYVDQWAYYMPWQKYRETAVVKCSFKLVNITCVVCDMKMPLLVRTHNSAITSNPQTYKPTLLFADDFHVIYGDLPVALCIWVNGWNAEKYKIINDYHWF